MVVLKIVPMESQQLQSCLSEREHFPPFTLSRVSVLRNPEETSNVGEHRGAKTNFSAQLCGLDFLSAGFLWLRFRLRDVNSHFFFEVKQPIMENGCETSFHTHTHTHYNPTAEGNDCSTTPDVVSRRVPVSLHFYSVLKTNLTQVVKPEGR